MDALARLIDALHIDRELLSNLAGSASFSIWLFAQTPQIYENYARGSVQGLSPFFLIQWMFGDLTNLIGAVLTHQLAFQVALASYFCFIDTILLLQFWYYSRTDKADRLSPLRPISVEEAERLLEEQEPLTPLTPSHSRPDTASLRSNSTRSRWGYHSMRQGSLPRNRERSQSTTGRKQRTRLTSNATTNTVDSSLTSLFSSHDDLRASRPAGAGSAGGPSSRVSQRHRSPDEGEETNPLIASISAGSVTYRALSHAAMSVAQIADEAAERERERERRHQHQQHQQQPSSTHRGREVARIDSLVRPPGREGSRGRRPTPAQRARSERSVGRAGVGMVLLSVGMLFAVGRRGDQDASLSSSVSLRRTAGVARWTQGSLERTSRWGRSEVDVRWREQAGTGDSEKSAPSIRTEDGLSRYLDPARPLLRRRRGRQEEDEGKGRDHRHDGHHHPPEPPSSLSPTPPPTPTPNPGKPTTPTPGRERPIKEPINWEQLVGRTSAWTCTVLYLTSRLPQIWTNHVRKSVEGLSMLLFMAAFLGNLLYTVSILASPRAGTWWTLFGIGVGGGPDALATWTSTNHAGDGLTGANKAFLRESLPFLIGSFGASFFDVTILSQWLAFR